MVTPGTRKAGRYGSALASSALSNFLARRKEKKYPFKDDNKPNDKETSLSKYSVK